MAKLAAIVECSDDAIVSKTLDGVIRTWNKGAERIFGYTPDEVIGKPITILIPADRQDEETQILARLSKGERVDHFQTIRKTKDGRLINVSVTISPIRDSTGEVVGASKIARDITTEIQQQQLLKEAKEVAEAANRAKDQFLAVLSHELRTPLTPVLAAMDYMDSQANLPADIREQVAMVRRNINTEARLIDDLLDITRIARGKIGLHFEIVDAHEMLRSVLKMLQSQIDEKKLEITMALRAGMPHVWADPGRLQQIFLNVVSNAVKFTPKEGAISVRTSMSEEQCLHVEIKDTGPGMSAELLGRLFKAFEQDRGSNQFGGLGLGLAIAKSLAQMHQGTISAASKGPGEGSVFTIELPAIEPNETLPNIEIAKRVSSLKQWRLLLVEDHEDTRRILSQLLQKMGCIVAVAASVHEAIAITSRQSFDLLISDIGLPDGSGIEIIRHVRKHHKLKGIALSGYGHDDDIRRSREAGFETHLIKPVNFHTLEDAVNRALQ